MRSATAQPATPRTAAAHTPLEDAAALLTGVLLVSAGVALFQQAGLLTGGMAGLAFALHYASHWGFGPWFFVLNLPFYWLAIRKMGWVFTLKTFAAVGLLSLASGLQPRLLHIDMVEPGYAAIAGGMFMGIGMLVLFRHRCSLGGFGITALYLQERYGWRAGHVQMLFDCLVLLSAFFIVELDRALWSVVAAASLNLVLSMNHRPGRYGA